MKANQIIENNIVKGTNCGNCIFSKNSISEEASKNELNAQGGIIPQTKEEIELSKIGDLVTLPGNLLTNTKVFCKHIRISQWVTDRMCCAYWDTPGVIRSFEK